MTTQAIHVTLSNGSKAVLFTATCTDDGYTELKDETNTKSLGDITSLGTVTEMSGQYVAGGGLVRVKDGNGNVKLLEGLSLANRGAIRELARPVTIAPGDMIDALAVAVPI